MVKDIYSKKELASSWFNQLQETVCYEFEKIEHDFGKKTKKKPKNFIKKKWRKSKIKNEGGGAFSTIRNGLVFDSVGVNFSEVSGKFHKKFRSQILRSEPAEKSLKLHFVRARAEIVPDLVFKIRSFLSSTALAKNCFSLSKESQSSSS